MGQACADPGARTPIGVIGNFLKQTPLLGQESWNPEDPGMAAKGSQEALTLVWLKRKGVHPLQVDFDKVHHKDFFKIFKLWNWSKQNAKHPGVEHYDKNILIYSFLRVPTS